MEASERNKKMLRIRKLLAMGKDDRGNEHETEAAMRMANKLMAELGIEEADINMAALDANTMQFGEQLVHPDGKEFVAGMKPKAIDSTSSMKSPARRTSVITAAKTFFGFRPASRSKNSSSLIFTLSRSASALLISVRLRCSPRRSMRGRS